MKTMYSENKIWLEEDNGTVVGEIDFLKEQDGVYNIVHTGVDPSQRGKGTAGKLVQAAADYIRSTGSVMTASCSYASKWLEEHEAYHDVYVQRSRE